MSFDRNRLPLAVAVAVSGVVLPFLTWGYAKAIDERLVFEAFPDPILLGFNGVAFTVLAVAAFHLPRAAAVGGLLGLVAISIQLHRGYWQSHSSTTALPFLFYLPWAFIATALGCALGYVAGRLGRVAAAIPLLVYGAWNVRWSNYGRFHVPAEIGVVESDEPRLAVEKSAFFTTDERRSSPPWSRHRLLSLTPYSAAAY